MAALFVRNLHPEVTEVMLTKRFSYAGYVQSVRICRDKRTGSPLGNAYVNFRYRHDAERALKIFNFEPLLGRPMSVMWSQWKPKANTMKGGKIFIRNLDWSVNSISLFDTFSEFGRIVSCKAVESKGFGYIQYESAKAAALAIECLNGKLLNNRRITIEYFKSWEEREAEVCKAEAHKATTKLLRAVRPPCFETRTPAVEPPHSEDTVQTVEASAPEDTVQTVEASAPEDTVQTVEASAPEDTVQTVEASAPEDTVQTVEASAPEDTVQTVEASASERTLSKTVEASASEDIVQIVDNAASNNEVPKSPPPQKRLTIYILESAPLEDQVQMAHDYMLPLVEEIHPTDANQITWMIVQEENNFEIMNIISDPELLRTKVDKMDALLRARAAGYKPETLKMIFKTDNKKRRKKKKNNRKNL
ncbi:hypothetical protein QTP70_030768 [Hemibagrus guttatus]|uniref:Uncharacterized protein n=1 Tax=Hemibagrus guttatus TaxID=175788 RepID=A0AAE0UZU4_9TELE|nr:hypothetical protein QTP70_030768 [Hemibagrus guttatus]